MTIKDKAKKLLEYSVIVKPKDKKAWIELLPKMSDAQAQTLYDVLVGEVKAWKKEGISLIQDLTVESQLLPEDYHGSTVGDLKARLEGKIPPSQKPSVPPLAGFNPTTPFGKELKHEVETPELTKPGQEKASSPEDEKPDDDIVFGEIKEELPNAKNNAWMLSNKVVVPKPGLGIIKPAPMSVPKIRNRVPKRGLAELGEIASIDDLKKIEPAHLRQGPLKEQLNFIKQRIGQLAKELDMLPASIIPVFEQSPLFQTYLLAGSMMIEKNLDEDKIALDQVMAELENSGKDSLSQQEFEAVADLKQELEAMSGL